MPACEQHDRLVQDIEHLRKDIDELYQFRTFATTEIARLTERDDRRKNDLEKLESLVTEGNAELKGMIQALSSQISSALAEQARKIEANERALADLSNLPAKKKAERVEEIMQTLLKYLVASGVGGAILYGITKLFGG